MKTSLVLGLLLIGSTLTGYAQTKEKKKLLIDDVELVYTVSDKNERNGPVYIKNESKLFMKGMNTNGKPSGKWYFYGEDGNLESYYNYDQQKLLFIDSTYLGTLQIQVKADDPEAQKNTSIPILLYPSKLLVKQLTTKADITPTDFDGKDTLPINVTAQVMKNGDVDYFVSFIYNGKKIIKPIETNKEFQEIFIPAQYDGKPVESFYTISALINNDGSIQKGHQRFTWNY